MTKSVDKFFGMDTFFFREKMLQILTTKPILSVLKLIKPKLSPLNI